MSLTPTQVATIKSTVPVLAQHGNTITSQFYHTLLQEHPSLKNIFNNTHQATGHQASALASALYAYAANIDELGNLSAAVELICHKHASLYIKSEHYDVVGEGLLRTMKDVLGEAATDDVLGAWGAAYWQLANIMIGKEKELIASTGPWNTWRDFRITRKEREAHDITSFYLEPVDPEIGANGLNFKPGQYISVNLLVDELDGGVWQARQYSLSDAPGKSYLRISVKKEPGVALGDPRSLTHTGYISSILHEKRGVGDVVAVSHPFGDFYWEDEGDGGPVVLVSAGVGLTCLMSILNAIVEGEDGGKRPVTWIQGARSRGYRAFKTVVDELAAKKESLRTVYFSSKPEEGEVQGRDYHVKGRVDLEKVDRKDLHLEDKRTKYFICGPTQFMLDTEAKLKSFGVNADNIKLELFGTGGVPRV